MHQAVEGLLYLHSHGILHRDLTLANLLLTKNMDAVSLSYEMNEQSSILRHGYLT